MTEKELKKLSRSELLEMLIAQGRKTDRLEKELKEAKDRLESRKIAVSSSGTLAEAAMKLNGVFEAADKAAQQYLESLQAQSAEAEKIIAEAQERAEQITKQAECEKAKLLADSEQEVRKRVESFNAQFKEFINKSL